MKKELRTEFSTRQYMVSKDFELYYYSDTTPFQVAVHTHDYYEFYFFLEGDVSIELEETEYPVSYGDILLMRPQVRHRPLIHGMDVPYRRFVFWISADYLDYLISVSPEYGYFLHAGEAVREPLLHNDRVSFHVTQSKLLRLIEELKGTRFGRDRQVMLCAEDLLLHLNRLFYERRPRYGGEQSVYQNVSRYIEQHLDEDLSLDALAREFYVSKYHIAHIFKDNVGISVHQYIIKKRLEACRNAILSHTGINEACYLYGFSDYTSFYRAFKKEYGMSPREYKDLYSV